jgi:hypothetical protein
MRLIALCLALLPLHARADTLMTAAEFESLVTGKVMDFAQGGQVWGTEQYKPNRRVLWAFTAAECREGFWYPEGDQICFVYEDPNDPQCWLFYKTDTGVKVRFVGDPPGSEMSTVTQSPGPLGCPGPNVGV